MLQLFAIHRKTLPHPPLPKGARDQFEYQEFTLEQTNSAFHFHVFLGGVLDFTDEERSEKTDD